MQPNNPGKRASIAARVLAYPEPWFRPADRLDLAIRRWIIPPEVHQLVAATRRGESRSMPPRDLSMRNFTEIHAAIGRYLRAQYDDLAQQPIPARLVDLLQQLEQRDGHSEQIAA
jgi:hypothetical protein